MFTKFVIFVTLTLTASSVVLSQDTFPRDGNEALAMRLHDWYGESQARLTNLKNGSEQEFVQVPAN